MSDKREAEALAAYLKLLQAKGATSESLSRRESFLTQLATHLDGRPLDGHLYRDAVESLIESMRQAEWPFFLAVAREYYPFWTQDFKAIAALHAEAGFNADPLEWQPSECNLKTLWNGLDKELFSTSETWPLKAYTLALRQEGASQALVDTRVKLVKLLLVRLRDAPQRSPKIYRIAVDATAPLFNLKETRRLFLSVVREFYYFWIGDPEAAHHILQYEAAHGVI